MKLPQCRLYSVLFIFICVLYMFSQPRSHNFLSTLLCNPITTLSFHKIRLNKSPSQTNKLMAHRPLEDSLCIPFFISISRYPERWRDDGNVGSFTIVKKGLQAMLFRIAKFRQGTLQVHTHPCLLWPSVLQLTGNKSLLKQCSLM